jgi:hypothetical protein
MKKRIYQSTFHLIMLVVIFSMSSMPCFAAKKEPPSTETPGVVASMRQGPMKNIDTLIFASRSLAGNLHYYENYGRGYSAKDYRYGMKYKEYDPGHSTLSLLDIPSGKVTHLVEDPGGGLRDPIVNYDAEKILFSWRKSGTHHYHLYEINIDGSGLRQLTDGEFDDVEPTYLPSGQIVFISSRGNRRVPCWSSQVGLLYRCEADGSGIVRISAGVEHENTPWVLSDGTLLYTRWEYVDRSEIDYHHLWTANPDGTRHMTYYGNMVFKNPVIAYLDAKPIPGTGKVVSSFVFHNTPEHAGHIMIIDPQGGPDDLDMEKRISPNAPPPIGESSPYKKPELWRDPYPMSEDCFLVASQKTIYVMNGKGEYEKLYALEGGNKRFWIHEPRPVIKRQREPVIPETINLDQKTGRLILSDINIGRRMDGIKKGEIKELLVMEELPKPVSHSVDPDLTSLESTFILHRILGTVPVEPDGSAYMELPANRALFFVALDENKRAVKRMMSFVSLMPGETTGCVGCHENRTVAPPAMDVAMVPALEKRSATIEPLKDVPDIIDYVRDVQPIRDKNCVKCHNYEKYAGKLSLTGDRSPSFTHSYLNIAWAGLVSHGDQGRGNRAPYSIGAVDSKLYQMINKPHHGVELSGKDKKTIWAWIESSVAWAGTYGALGSYQPRVKAPKNILRDRCSSCHKPGELHQRWQTGRNRLMDRWYNISRPEKSLALLAPLSKEAGGLGLCQQREAKQLERDKSAPPAVVFKSKDDPAYLALLKAIEDGADMAKRVPAYYEKAYKAPRAYVDEMQRFGVLPENVDPQSIDLFKTDEKYYSIFEDARFDVQKNVKFPEGEK